jgi:beta-glucanase (GH16 family)
MMEDKSWMIDMKAEILRRAQEPSDDEEEESEYDAYGEKIVRKKRPEPFEDDAWDGPDDGLTHVTVAGDGEAADESDGQDDTVGTSPGGTVSSLTTIISRHSTSIRSKQFSNWHISRIRSCSIVMPQQGDLRSGLN